MPRTDILFGALELLRACSPGQSPEAILGNVVRIVREFVAFDVSTFAEYETEPPARRSTAPPCILVRGRYATDGNEPFKWPARWMRAPAGILGWLDGKDVGITSFDDYFREHPEFAGLKHDPITQSYLDRDARDFIVVVIREDERPVSTLTFARKGGRKFTADDQLMLGALGLADIVRQVRAAYRRKAVAFHNEIRDLFAQHAHPDDVAKTAVKRLCEGFDWDYVAIFRVAHSRARFEMVEQHNATNKNLSVKKNYTQPINDGVLGEVLHSGRPVSVEDAATHPSYIQLASDARSCLCYPIIVDGAVEWILDCESSEVGAFQLPDQMALGALVAEAQKTVALWFEMRLNRALLANIDQGVLVVDQVNHITRLNAKGAELLGTALEPMPSTGAGVEPTDRPARHLKGMDLSDFGADEEARAVLAAGIVAVKPLRLRGLDGLLRNVLVSSRDSEDLFNRRVWRLTDPKAWDWVTDLEYMRTTVQGVAYQTRGPLLLANVLLSQVGKLLQNDKSNLPGLLAKIRSSLAKTDITYERLVAGLEAERQPAGTPLAVDVHSLLKSFIAALPEDDRSAVEMTVKGHPPDAWADPDRLRFVLHSTIGYLLSTRLPGQTIGLRLRGGPQGVGLKLTAPGLDKAVALFPTRATDPVTRAQDEAQEATDHGLSTVRKVIEESGGTLTARREAGALTLRFTLPAAPSGRATAPRMKAHG